VEEPSKAKKTEEHGGKEGIYGGPRGVSKKKLVQKGGRRKTKVRVICRPFSQKNREEQYRQEKSKGGRRKAA